MRKECPHLRPFSRLVFPPSPPDGGSTITNHGLRQYQYVQELLVNRRQGDTKGSALEMRSICAAHIKLNFQKALLF